MGVGTDPFPGTGIPHLLFMVFQLMFAAITVALITGSFAERMKFTALIAFAVPWSTFIYSPLAHWVGGGRWLAQMGALDFAGGAVVHISSGFGALICAILIGKRTGLGMEAMPLHNLPIAVLGTGLLWFGFNAGSALGANEVAVSAFVATHIAACAGGFSWMIAEWIYQGKPTIGAQGLFFGNVGSFYSSVFLNMFFISMIFFFSCRPIQFGKNGNFGRGARCEREILLYS